jgi:ABC-2 type transport system ATP-binding protein
MLKCEGIVKKYMSCTAIENISVDILPGKIYALLGPNGSGKTTLMKIITGLIKPTQGTVTLDGISVSPATKAHVAYMPTENFFYSYMTTKDVGNFYNDFYEDFDMNLYNKLLADFNLTNAKDKVKNMSSGMMAKLKVAVTIARRSAVTLLDEPLNGIDIIAREKIINVITENFNPNTTYVISSHLVDELEKIIDSAIFVKDGLIIENGDAEQLRQKYNMTIVDMYKHIYAE